MKWYHKVCLFPLAIIEALVVAVMFGWVSLCEFFTGDDAPFS